MFLSRSAFGLAAFFFSLNGFASAVKTGIVAELNKNEVYEGLLHHGGNLYVGQLRANENEKHRVDIYIADGSVIAGSVQLDHSASFIYPYSNNEVLVVGRSSWPWMSHYTIISRSGTSFSKRMVTFPEQYQVYEFAGKNGNMFFNEPGSRALFKVVGTRNLTDMNIEVSGPGQMELDGDILWVLERKSLYLGDENIVMVQTKLNQHKRLFETDRNGLTNFLIMKNHDVLAASEYAGGQIVLVKKSSGKILEEISIPGGPRGLAQIGNCIAVMGEEEKTIHFIYVNGDVAHEIDQWDISAAGDRLKQPRRLVADAVSGRIFVRSNYPCPSCSVTQSSVFFAEQEGRETFDKCLSR